MIYEPVIHSRNGLLATLRNAPSHRYVLMSQTTGSEFCARVMHVDMGGDEFIAAVAAGSDAAALLQETLAADHCDTAPIRRGPWPSTLTLTENACWLRMGA